MERCCFPFSCFPWRGVENKENVENRKTRKTGESVVMRIREKALPLQIYQITIEMNQNEINALAASVQAEARKVIDESGIVAVWQSAGCRVNLVGSVRMGLLISNRDIDLHVYSRDITEESTFAIGAKMAALPGVTELTAINGLHTDEHCMAWHVKYQAKSGEVWKFDIIHIEEASTYDGYFERMADRIVEVMTPRQRDIILRLKSETPSEETIRGVEYYEAVLADGVESMAALREWLVTHRSKPPYYWIP